MSVKHFIGGGFNLPPQHGHRPRLASNNLCGSARPTFDPRNAAISRNLDRLRLTVAKMDRASGIYLDALGRCLDDAVKRLVELGAVDALTRQVNAERAASGFSRTAITWRRIDSAR